MGAKVWAPSGSELHVGGGEISRLLLLRIKEQGEGGNKTIDSQDTGGVEGYVR